MRITTSKRTSHRKARCWLNELPNELLMLVFGYCDGATQLSLELTCRRFRQLVRKCQATQSVLDVQLEYNLKHSRSFTTFAQYLLSRYPYLRSLSLRGCPVYLDRTNLCRLCEMYPHLCSINVSQLHAYPKVSHDCLTALENFTHLRELVIDRIPLTVAHDATTKRAVMMPADQVFERLTSFSLLCNSGYLFRLLMVLKCSPSSLTKRLRSVQLGNRSWVTLNHSDFQLLLWFLKDNSKHLREVRLQDFCFATEQDSAELLNEVLQMPQLQTLELHSCTIRSLTTTYCEDDHHRNDIIADRCLQHVIVKSSDQMFTRVLRKTFSMGDWPSKHDSRLIYPDGIEIHTINHVPPYGQRRRLSCL